MKRTHALLLIALVVVTALTTLIVYVNTSIAEVTLVPMDLRVAETYAFNADPDAIHFGRVVPGGGATRGFTLNNTRAYPLVAELRVDGPLASWVSSTDNLVMLDPGTTFVVNLTANVPVNASFGTYNGTLIVVFRRAP